jgi:hypothetical protein
VHPLGARVLPRVDPLPRILTSESFLVVHLAPMSRASLRSVALLNVKSTQKTDIPICILLHNVGMRGVGRLGRLSGESTCGGQISNARCHATTSSCPLRITHMVYKWGSTSLSPCTVTTSTSAFSSSSAPAVSSIIPCSVVETAIRLSRKGGNVQLLDGRNMVFCCRLGLWCGGGLNDIASIWFMMAVWLATN